MSELGRTFMVPKATGTHGDILAAVGLADLLRNIPRMRPVRVKEVATGFLVEVPRSITPDDIQQLPHSPGYAFLKASERVRVPPGVQSVFDYKVQKDRVDRYRQLATLTRGKVIDAETKARLQELQPPADWRLWQALNILQGDETSNRVHCAILGMPAAQFHEELLVELSLLGRPHTPAVSWKASTVQLFTPNAAKGYSRLKPDTTDRNDKTKDQWTDPFLEWLRYRGYFVAALPYFQGSKGEDIRLLCPVPSDVSIDALHAITTELRAGRIFGRSPKLDSLAALELASLLISKSGDFGDEGAEPIEGLELAGKTPAEIISGIATTHYQSMGSSKAVAAMSVIALPGWFPIDSGQDARDWRNILEEHRGVLRGLQDDHSDEIGLLIAYRRFLEQRSEAAFQRLVEFVEQYGSFLIRAREQGRHVRALTTTAFRRLTEGMAPHLTEILRNDGFQAIATAVRRATVNAQAQKAMKVPDYREIRYDLLPDLRRTRTVPGSDFVEIVSDFIAKYNVENARRRELNKKFTPANVTTEQIMDFMSLVETYGSSLVGALLCAYGSCREPRDSESTVLGDSESSEDSTTEEIEG